MDDDVGTCVSASMFAPHIHILKVRIAWPAMPRSTMDFSTRIYGRLSLECSHLKVYVPHEGVENNLLKFTFGGKYKLCSFIQDNVADSNHRCDYQCTCVDNVCQALYVFLPSTTEELCEVEFPP